MAAAQLFFCYVQVVQEGSELRMVVGIDTGESNEGWAIHQDENVLAGVGRSKPVLPEGQAIPGGLFVKVFVAEGAAVRKSPTVRMQACDGGSIRWDCRAKFHGCRCWVEPQETCKSMRVRTAWDQQNDETGESTVRLLFGLVLLGLAACASVASPGPSSDIAEINRVIESFKTAMVERDRERFLSLFLHDRVVWQGVNGDATLERMRIKLPKATKAPINPKNTHITFIDGIIKDPKRNEEVFNNVRIDTDGDIASVYFDYVYLEDGLETNHGAEGWQLVRSKAGWKIVAVVWSQNDPDPIAQ